MWYLVVPVQVWMIQCQQLLIDTMLAVEKELISTLSGMPNHLITLRITRHMHSDMQI